MIPSDDCGEIIVSFSIYLPDDEEDDEKLCGTGVVRDPPTKDILLELRITHKTASFMV